MTDLALPSPERKRSLALNWTPSLQFNSGLAAAAQRVKQNLQHLRLRPDPPVKRLPFAIWPRTRSEQLGMPPAPSAWQTLVVLTPSMRRFAGSWHMRPRTCSLRCDRFLRSEKTDLVRLARAYSRLVR